MKVCAIVLQYGDISIQRYNDISRHGLIDKDYSLVGEGEFRGGGRADRLLRVDQAERRDTQCDSAITRAVAQAA